MIDISGKWALVTGASRGIGRRVAAALADKGCRLILHSRKTAGTDTLAEAISATGTEVYQIGADLSEPGAVSRITAQTHDISGGRIDILYNNAAVMTDYLDTFTVPEEDFALSFLINTIVPVKLCDAFLPDMLARNWGRVVNVTSGISDQPQLMAYSCSKAALDRYVRDMIPALSGTNVLLNLMDPGWLRTDMGGPDAPNDPDSVLPGALVPVLLDETEGSGKLYRAQDYSKNRT